MLRVVSVEQYPNIPSISVTLLVSKFLRSRVLTDEQSKNIYLIFVTLLVLNLLTSMFPRELQLLNILRMDVHSSVFRFAISTLSSLEHSQNI